MWGRPSSVASDCSTGFHNNPPPPLLLVASHLPCPLVNSLSPNASFSRSVGPPHLMEVISCQSVCGLHRLLNFFFFVFISLLDRAGHCLSLTRSITSYPADNLQKNRLLVFPAARPVRAHANLSAASASTPLLLVHHTMAL